MDQQRYMDVHGFIDGELDDHQSERVIDLLLEDSHLKKRWSEYHAISDKLHNPTLILAPPDFASRISDKISQEPTVFAPKALHHHRAPLPLWSKVGAVAVAASVAMVSIFVLTPNMGQNGLGTVAENDSWPASSYGVTTLRPAGIPAGATAVSWTPAPTRSASSLQQWVQRGGGVASERNVARH